jgi:hypothetical protein
MPVRGARHLSRRGQAELFEKIGQGGLHAESMQCVDFKNQRLTPPKCNTSLPKQRESCPMPAIAP